MDPDRLQQAWQAQGAGARISVDADWLRKNVERQRRELETIVNWRDVREVGTSLVMIPVWLVMGYFLRLPWTWYLCIPAFFWVGGFILVDRRRHGPRPNIAGESLLTGAKESLRQVEHQIWLLRNVLWWYLLPFGIPIAIFFADVVLNSFPPINDWQGVVAALFLAACLFGGLVVTYGFLYILNQRAVRTQLEPRRQELLTLLATLGDEHEKQEGATMSATSSGGKSALFWTIILAGLFGLATTCFAVAPWLFGSKYDGPPRSSGAEGEWLAAKIADLRREKSLVALGAMVTVDGEVVATAAVGERMIGRGVSVELGDRWHLGSITKSVTATMIARLIESGQMQWTDTVGQRFPGTPLHEDWKPVTLQQLLTHTAGAPANFPLTVMLKQPALGPECTAARRQAVVDVLTVKPIGTPGEKFAYSNVGYTIAAVMAEEATGVSWNELVEREVFEPLKLTGAGFGPPKSPTATLDQPRGHRKVLIRKVGMGDDADNTFIMAPAGAVHLTLGDLSRYAGEHLRGELGTAGLLSVESMKQLHTPRLNQYACGWVVNPPSSKIPHTVYWHNGSNTMWYALVVFIPGKNMVVAVTSNDGDIPSAEAAAWEVVEAAAGRFKTEQDEALRAALPASVRAKRSPFAAVRWNETQPEVQIGDEWFTLVALDDLPAGEIVAFSRTTYGERWQKRFEEDLVEVLDEMKHRPGETVRLVVKPVGSEEARTLDKVPMTEANRRAIYAAALKRKLEQSSKTPKQPSPAP